MGGVRWEVVVGRGGGRDRIWLTGSEDGWL